MSDEDRFDVMSENGRIAASNKSDSAAATTIEAMLPILAPDGCTVATRSRSLLVEDLPRHFDTMISLLPILSIAPHGTSERELLVLLIRRLYNVCLRLSTEVASPEAWIDRIQYFRSRIP